MIIVGHQPCQNPFSGDPLIWNELVNLLQKFMTEWIDRHFHLPFFGFATLMVDDQSLFSKL